MQITGTQVLRALGKNQDKADKEQSFIYDDAITVCLKKPYVFDDGWSLGRFPADEAPLQTIQEWSKGIRAVDPADWRSLGECS